jgi:hypothetical protein
MFSATFTFSLSTSTLSAIFGAEPVSCARAVPLLTTMAKADNNTAGLVVTSIFPSSFQFGP